MPTDLFTHFDPSKPLEAGEGPLRGKSFVVQPSLLVRGWPSGAGSAALEGYVALEDATAVERLKKAGAALAGSTRMSEMGFGLAGDTTGAVLAGGSADLALMGDRMGEARVAAARAGVFGFKPTKGLVSNYGWVGLSPSLESLSILAREAADIPAALEAVAGPDGRDFSLHGGEGAPAGRTAGGDPSAGALAVVAECLETLGEESSRAFRDGLARLRDRGIAVREVRLRDFPLFREIHQVIGSVEASSSCGKFDGVRYGHRAGGAKNWNDMYIRTRAESFGTLLKTYLFQGAYFQFENYGAFENAARIRTRLVREGDALFDGVDALVSPVFRDEGDGGTAPETVGSLYDEFSLALPANVGGLPSLQIPGVVLSGKTDFGLQVTGPRFSDRRLLAFAARLSSSPEGVA